MAAGDLMLGGQSFSWLEREGGDYPFRALDPLLHVPRVLVANLEGPISRKGVRRARRFVYRIRPRMARVIAKAGVGILSLANNHILDCGREGLLETIQVVREGGMGVIGAGINLEDAHRPEIREIDGLTVGFLGYYWHHRCEAGPDLPGSAMDRPEQVAADIAALKRKVDRIVLTCHWDVPYQREPSEETRIKARHAVEAGADVVIGHHPHVIQPLEVHRGRPIFYSVGNFAFGTGNSKAEGLLVGLRFLPREIASVVVPIYVRNRDPRVYFQPRALRGEAGSRALRHLQVDPAAWKGSFQDRDGWGFLRIREEADGA